MELSVVPRCFENNKFGIFETNKILGQGTYGTVYKICITKKCYALKETQGETVVSKKKDTSELFFLYFCRELNKNGITENLQNSLKFYTCDLCNSFYSLHKVETGDCHQFFKTKKTTYEWKNMYFQILYGLYVFQKYLDGVHFDLYPRNVLYSFQPATKHTTRYTIGSKDYYLEDTGYVFKISDFGLSYSKSLEICNDTNKRPWKYYLNYKKGSFINVMEVDSFNICNSFYQYQKFQDLLIEEMLGVWYEMYFQDHLVLVPDIINKIFYSFEKKEKYKKWFNSNKSVK